MECENCRGYGFVETMVCYGNMLVGKKDICDTCYGDGELYCGVCGIEADYFCYDCEGVYCIKHFVKDFDKNKPICIECASTKEERQEKIIEQLKLTIVENEKYIRDIKIDYKECLKKNEKQEIKFFNLKTNPFMSITNDQLKDECLKRGISLYTTDIKNNVFRCIEMDKEDL